MTKKYKKTVFNKTGKTGIVLLGIGIFAITIAGYSYYNKGLNTSQTTKYSTVQNTRNTIQGGGCSMMGNNKVTSPDIFQTTNPDAEIINMTYNESGLEPAVINVQAGKAYTINIKSNTDIYGCMSTITIPGLDNSIQSILKGENIVFSIEPTTPGEYEFECAMGISHGAKIIVQ